MGDLSLTEPVLPGTLAYADMRAVSAEDGRSAGRPDTASPQQERAENGELDAYTPARTSYAEGDYPAAVRSADIETGVENCYCGSCEGCRLRADQAREQARQEEAGVREEDDEDAPHHAGELSEAEQRQVEELQRTDREVRAHEQAHVAAGARNPTYEYQTGPDGKQYAVGGSAQIDFIAPSDDPTEKVAQARKMRAAAMAPVDPSPKDMEVAARATRLETEALAELREAREEELAQFQIRG